MQNERPCVSWRFLPKPRREGYEIQVSRPDIVTKQMAGGIVDTFGEVNGAPGAPVDDPVGTVGTPRGVPVDTPGPTCG